MTRKPEIVYVTYIAATPQMVWDAITDSKFTRQYFFGRSVEVSGDVGGDFVMRMEDGRVDTRGKVLRCDPPHLLSVTWRVEWIEELRKLPEAIVTYKVEEAGNVTRLTVLEQTDESVEEKFLEGDRNGWPVILSGLKTLLETGRALDAPLPEPPGP